MGCFKLFVLDCFGPFQAILSNVCTSLNVGWRSFNLLVCRVRLLHGFFQIVFGCSGSFGLLHVVLVCLGCSRCLGRFCSSWSFSLFLVVLGSL